MFWFQRKEAEKRPEDVNLSQLQKRMTRLEAEMLDLTITIDLLRNKVLRKIQTKKISEEVESDLLDEAGFLKTS